MQIKINNRHPRIRLPKKPFRELAEKVLSGEKKKGEVSITFVDDETITELNRRYHKRNRPTDVLSFPFEIEEILGDIYISLDTAKRQAKEYKHNLTQEVRLLVVHGLLHLAGYDDQSYQARKTMRKREEYYLK